MTQESAPEFALRIHKGEQHLNLGGVYFMSSVRPDKSRSARGPFPPWTAAYPQGSIECHYELHAMMSMF